MKRILIVALLLLALLPLTGCQTETDAFTPPDDRRIDPKPWNAPADWQYNYVSPR